MAAALALTSAPGSGYHSRRVSGSRKIERAPVRRTPRYRFLLVCSFLFLWFPFGTSARPTSRIRAGYEKESRRILSRQLILGLLYLLQRVVPFSFPIKVGLAVADEPPRRSRRAVFPHRAPLNGSAVGSTRRCSLVREAPLVMFAIGLFHNGWVGHAKSFPHLLEAGPVVTFPLAPTV